MRWISCDASPLCSNRFRGTGSRKVISESRDVRLQCEDAVSANISARLNLKVVGIRRSSAAPLGFLLWGRDMRQMENIPALNRCDDNVIRNYWFSLFDDRLYVSQTNTEP